MLSCFSLLFVTLQVLQIFNKIVGQVEDCNGVYIDYQCHIFRLDVHDWYSAESTCAITYSVASYTAAHLTTVESAVKQSQIQDFMIRFGIAYSWVGATNHPLLWQWLSNRQVLQAEGCYMDDPNNKTFAYAATISGLSSEGCIDACRISGYGYAGLQNGGSCVCGNRIEASGITTGCNMNCKVPTLLSQWCGGQGLLTTVYRIGGANGQWSYNQPDNVASGKNCAFLDMSAGGNMTDDNCSTNYDFLCQINTTSCSGTGYQPLSNLCYYVSNGQSVNWTSASQFCQTLGGELATVDSNTLRQAIVYWFSSVFSDRNKRIWIGAFRGGWYWFAGYSFAYTNWAPGEPAPATNNNDQCILINSHLNYQWQALPCTMTEYFICQRGYDTFTTPALGWNGPTPPGWNVNGGVTSGPNGGSTGSTGSGGSTGSTGSGGSTGGPTDGTKSPYGNSTNNSTYIIVGPAADTSTQAAGWSNLAIGLFALLAIVLFILLLLGLLLLALCIAKKRG